MRQTSVQTMIGLAHAAIELKKANGWYEDGESRTTEAEDQEAMTDLKGMDDSPIADRCDQCGAALLHGKCTFDGDFEDQEMEALQRLKDRERRYAGAYNE